MEMELQHQALEGYRLIFDAPLVHEETMECIVPDALPDVGRIICATGRLCLRGKEVGAGTVRLTGTVCVSVLYLPDGADQPKAMRADLPFQCTRDAPQLKEGCQVHTAGWVCWADASEVNPRKLMLRACLRFEIQVYEQDLREVTCDVLSGEDAGLEKQITQATDYTVAEVVEKPFVFSEVVRQPSTKPPMEELLSYTILPGGAEAKAIGKKLVCKGVILLCALYRSGDEILQADFELPFSQILDLAQPREEGESEVSLSITGNQCTLQDGELAVSVEALVQAAVWARLSVDLLTDAYCTQAPLEVDRGQCVLCPTVEHNRRKETGRKFCESGIPARLVISCSSAVEGLELRHQDGQVSAAAQIRAQVLYLSEDGMPCAVSYLLPVECEFPASEDAQCSCRCESVGETTAVPVTGGLEVRCEAAFTWTLIRRENVPCVTRVQPGAVPVSLAPRPSLTIRMVGAGESLWDVAKACGSTIVDIREVNDLSTDQVEQGTILLIPGKHL